jgi:ABC-type transport system, involved in lipoprotein release, permease component
MKISLYIAKRLIFASKQSFSNFIIKIAIIAVALSVTVMILGGAITQGYQEIITKKFYTSWGQLHITPFLLDPLDVLNDQSFAEDIVLEKKITSLPQVKHILAYKHQSAIIKSNEMMDGIVLRGIRQQDISYMNERLEITNGSIQFNDSSYSSDIILSEQIATSLNLKLNDFFYLYFLNKNEFQPRIRKVRLVATYNTGLEEYDKHIGLCDVALLYHINQDEQQSIQGI